MNPKLKSALIGGIALGVVGALPYIDNVCCIAYLAGGVLASYLYLREQPPSARAPYGDGAVVGVLAGVFGGVAATLVVMIMGGMETAAEDLAAAFGAMEQQGVEVSQGVRDFFDTSDGVGAGLAGSFLVINVVSYVVLGCIGGLIGTAIFHRKEAAS